MTAAASTVLDLYDVAEVTCTGCGQTAADSMTCEGSTACSLSGCECLVEQNASCDRYDGMWACADHPFPSHRGCPECDPPDPAMPWE